MAARHENWSISGIDTSDHARVHIGHNYQHHDHRYISDESQLLSPAERQKAREDAILSSLSFAEMSARERTIDHPCDKTFDWIFDDQVTEREHYHGKEICNLMSRWLEHEHGMFFIVGKAGSGKSTLMRFLAGHETTSALLQTWARQNDCELAVCAHYFWCSGTALQASQEGLWRSILYAIAKSDRKLASAMFAERAGDGEFQTLAHLRKQPWARTDLINVLSLLVAQLEVQKVAICLFIDGLDEYQGDEVMLVEELRQLLASPYIKICASSRPRNLFEEAFGHEDHQWTLALHFLTRGDMLQLARTRLDKDVNFREIFSDEKLREDFIMAITDKSQGVFLWTVLVVREMIREAHQSGTIEELKERLDALPIEIGGREGLYQRIVERADPRYQKYTARLLLVMLERGYNGVYWFDVHFLYHDAKAAEFATQDCLGLDDRYRIPWDKKVEVDIKPWDDSSSDLSCRGLFLTCHQGQSGVHVGGANCQIDRKRLLEDTRRRIRKWCPDFIDTHDERWPSFSHRSVGEYLSLPEVRNSLTNLAGRDFDPVLTRCCLRLAHSRLRPGPPKMNRFEHDFLRMLAGLSTDRREHVRAILPKFERIHDTKWSSWGSTLPPHEIVERHIPSHFWAKDFCYSYERQIIVLHGGLDITLSSQAHAWFLALMVREGFVWHCREQWAQVPLSDRQATGTIIIAGLLFDPTSLRMLKEQAEVVRYLLCSGVDPNARYTWIKHFFWSEQSGRHVELSLWEAYVAAFPNFWAAISMTPVPWALEVLQLMLRDGHADKECSLPAGKKSLLSALKIEPLQYNYGLDRHKDYWNTFTGQLHTLLNAHGLLTRKERQTALEQGWIAPQANPKQSAKKPDAGLLGRLIKKFKG